MLDLKVNGKSLLLRSGTEATVEHVPPLFADGIEDSYSTPFEVPTAGNEEALGHVHELSLSERELSLKPAELHNAGQRLHGGALQVLASTPDTVRTSFSIDAFVDELRGVMLPDLLREEVLDRLQEEADDITLHARPRYAEGGNCQFPMFLNEVQYGDERPSWKPNASEWDATRTYDVNDLVRFTERTTMERTWVYQCNDAGGTVAGESPTTAPTKWRRTAYGLVNAWNAGAGTHYFNGPSSNFYTWVPWFYVKWIMRTALGKLGFRVEGTWMDDETTHELLEANTTTIDSVSEVDEANGWNAEQDTIVYFTPGDNWRDYHIPAQDENNDPLGQWDNSAFTWTCPTAGTWRFRLRLRMNRNVADQPGVNLSLLIVQLLDNTNTMVVQHIRSFYPGDDLFAQVELVATFGAGDVGNVYHFAARQSPFGAATQDAIGWPAGEGDHYVSAQVIGWLEAATPTVCTPDTLILPHRHMPKVELGTWLVAWCDAYNLKFTADMQERVVRLDHRERELQQAEGNTTEQSHRTVGTPELDHERRTTGFRLAWDVEDNEADELEEQPTEQYYTEDDLQAPVSVGQVAVLRSTRKLLRSVFVEGTFCWRQNGYHVPSVQRGDQQEAREVVPAVRPVHMEQVWLDGKEYLVPRMSEQGTSAFYHGKGDQTAIWACVYAPASSGDGTVRDVPAARSWGYGWDANDRADTTLILDSPDAQLPGVYQRNWQGWVAMLLAAEPVTWDLAVDMPFLLSKEWQGFMHLHGHRYLCERLPVSYRTDRSELVSRGAYLLKLRPYHPQPMRVPFACVGPGYGSFVLTGNLATYLQVTTSDGAWCIRRPDGGIESFPTGYGHEVLEANAGAYCLWATGGDELPAGSIDQIQATGGFSRFDLRGYSNLRAVTLTDSPALSEVLTEGLAQLRYIQIQNCALTAAMVDAIILNYNEAQAPGYIVLNGGTSAAPTAASLAKRTLLASLGHAITTN